MNNSSIKSDYNYKINIWKKKARSRSRDKEIFSENSDEDNKSDNSQDSNCLSQRDRKAYTINQKLEFVNKALKEGIKKTARVYGLGLTSSRRWNKEKDSLEEIINKKIVKI